MSAAEEAFVFLLRLPENADLQAGMFREWIFAHPRKWRFDFAWPVEKVAVEIEGVTWGDDGGRHQRAQGFLGDCEKYEAALRLGWRVYRVPGMWLWDGSRMIGPLNVVETLRILLDRPTPEATVVASGVRVG